MKSHAVPSDQVNVPSLAESEPPIQHEFGQSALTSAFSLELWIDARSM